MIFRRTLDIRKGEFFGAFRYTFGKKEKDSLYQLAKWEKKTAEYIGVRHASTSISQPLQLEPS